jgi:plasmid stabilization system protein ParE
LNRLAFFIEEAKRDLSESRDWYNAEVEDLGYDFVEEVRKAVNRVESNAEQFTLEYRDARICPVKRFPFLVVFRIKGQQVEILAVMHGHRNPKTWMKRIGG